MNKGVIATVIVAALAAGGGYWIGKTDVSGQPEKTAKTERRVLYYRNPMGLPDTSPTPKKDPMGMDYIPVYEGEQEETPSAGLVKISPEKIQKIGVRTEAVAMQSLDKLVRAAGRVEPDERRTYAISPKFEGYVERLHVNATGQAVGKGQPLFEVYSPELVSAQREYAIASQGVESMKAAGAEAQSSMRQLADASLARLRNWDISEEQLKALARSGDTKRTLTFRSPVAGIVTEKKAVQGMRFMPGEALYQVTDLSSVWVIADVFEQDIGLVKTGAKATLRINAYPDKFFEGKVAYVYPTLASETRTIPVRIELPNPGGLLKPGMFAQVELPTTGKGPVLTVPTSAVIDSGVRRIVLIESGEGRFEPREVKLGARSDDRVTVLDGLREGERVVVTANFLIDAESNLKAAVTGFTPPSATPSTPEKKAGVGHQAEGKIEEIDAKAGTVSITHGPVASLNWPGMTMDFKLANAALLGNLKPGAAIRFEFVERGQGDWVITSISPAASAPAHAGHQ
jgi:RND family efflux transporter MFP subunit